MFLFYEKKMSDDLTLDECFSETCKTCRYIALAFGSEKSLRCICPKNLLEREGLDIYPFITSRHESCEFYEESE